MSDANPYRLPETKAAGVTTSAARDGVFLERGRAVETGQGWQWISAGYALFRKQPALWIGMLVVLIIIFLLLSLVPVVGALATSLLFPVFGAGFIIACQTLDQGGEMEFAHMFAGFKRNTGNLIVVGALYLVGIIVAMIPAFILLGSIFIGAMTGMGGDPSAMMVKSMGKFMLGMLLYLALVIPVAMAVWFAPALVVLHDRRPVEAMKASFFACLGNLIPFLVYGVILIVLAVVAAIPLGLGFLVLGPVFAASIYTAYRDIFFEHG